MPYGLQLADWDQLLSDEQLEDFFTQLGVVNPARTQTLCLHVIYHDAGRVRDKMMEKGFADIHPLYVYKPQQNARGMNFIFAVDVILVGYKPSINACAVKFDNANPHFRHNLLYGHQVGPKLKKGGSQEDVNTTQKNPNVSFRMGNILGKPGGNALVVGVGSGTEVISLTMAGMNVVGIEKDADQFQAACARLADVQEKQAAILDQFKVEVEQVATLTRLASKFTKLIHDENVHFSDEKAPGQQDQNEIVRKLACCACASEMLSSEVADCCKSGCAAKFHASTPSNAGACGVKCETCGSVFCSSDCSADHACRSGQ